MATKRMRDLNEKITNANWVLENLEQERDGLLREGRWGKNEDYPDGSILEMHVKFQSHPEQAFVYLVIKFRHHWYITGMYQSGRLSWYELVETWLERSERVYIVTALEEI